MIRFTRINGTGMFCYGYVPTINIDKQGLVFIEGVNEDQGGSNGSGKSAFINVLKEIGWGKNDYNKSGPAVVNGHKDWKNGCFGALWLTDHNDIHWRMFLLRKWKGNPPDESILLEKSEVIANGNKYNKTDVFLERWDPNEAMWMDERATSSGNKRFVDTQIKFQNEVVGMSYDQFCACISVGQRNEFSLLAGSSGDREKIIKIVTDVSVWDKAAGLAKVQLDTTGIEVDKQKAKVDTIANVLNGLTIPSEEDIAAAEEKLESNKSQINEIVQKITSNQIECNQNKTAQDAIDAANIKDEIDILAAEEAHARSRYENRVVPDIPEELIQIRSDISKYKHSTQIYNNDLNKYTNLGVGSCNECGQEITDEHLKRECGRIQKEILQLEAKIEDLTIQEANLDAKYKESCAKAEQEAKDAFNAEFKKIEARTAGLQNKEYQYNQYQQEINRLTNEHNSLVQQHTTLIATTTVLEQNLDQLRGRAQEHAEQTQKLESERQELEALVGRAAHWKWVERNLKTLKLQEYNNIILRINQILNDRIASLWGPGLHVRFVTAQEKSRGGVKQGIDLLVHTPNKEKVPIELYSGGQRKIMVVAMFLAGRRLMREQGQMINIAAIDELDKELDDHKTDKLVNAFEAIYEDCETCFVISHNNRLQNTMQFDQVWTVRMKNEMSNIETPNQTKVVAA